MVRRIPIAEGVILEVRDLGKMSYREAYDLQRRLQAEIIASRAAENSPRVMYLLLLEHVPAVITVSRRAEARRHLLADEDTLAASGIEIHETDRGGDITYHGPGQLVVYPILDLNVLRLRLHGYMRLLEQVVIDLLGEFGIDGYRDPDATGVWVRSKRARDGRKAPGPSAKICALGVRITRWVSMHGLALNVTTDLNHFDFIVPCGLAGRKVTTMALEVPDRDVVSPSEVKCAMVRHFARALAGGP